MNSKGQTFCSFLLLLTITDQNTRRVEKCPFSLIFCLNCSIFFFYNHAPNPRHGVTPPSILATSLSTHCAGGISNKNIRFEKDNIHAFINFYVFWLVRSTYICIFFFFFSYLMRLDANIQNNWPYGVL